MYIDASHCATRQCNFFVTFTKLTLKKRKNGESTNCPPPEARRRAKSIIYLYGSFDHAVSSIGSCAEESEQHCLLDALVSAFDLELLSKGVTLGIIV